MQYKAFNQQQQSVQHNTGLVAPQQQQYPQQPYDQQQFAGQAMDQPYQQPQTYAQPYGQQQRQSIYVSGRYADVQTQPTQQTYQQQTYQQSTQTYVEQTPTYEEPTEQCVNNTMVKYMDGVITDDALFPKSDGPYVQMEKGGFQDYINYFIVKDKLYQDSHAQCNRVNVFTTLYTTQKLAINSFKALVNGLGSVIDESALDSDLPDEFRKLFTDLFNSVFAIEIDDFKEDYVAAHEYIKSAKDTYSESLARFKEIMKILFDSIEEEEVKEGRIILYAYTFDLPTIFMYGTRPEVYVELENVSSEETDIIKDSLTHRIRRHLKYYGGLQILIVDGEVFRTKHGVVYRAKGVL